jgi:hypothetical protein
VTFEMKHLFHATHFVPSLSEAVEAFTRVFGRETVPLRQHMGSGDRPEDPRNTSNYATFTQIAEVVIECIDPKLHRVDGVQPNPDVSEAHLKTLAWFVVDVDDLWSELRRRGIRGTDQKNAIPAGDGPPVDISGTPIIFCLPEETGLRYELCTFVPRRDPRGDPPVPAVSDTDPLGIVRCSHHTVLTDQLDRARRLLVDVLGGRVIHEGRDEARGLDSAYLALSDGIVELGRPTEDGSPEMADWRAHTPVDTYHAMTWTVRDLDPVAAQMERAGVPLRTRTDTTIVVEPGNALGVPWGFTTAGIPGDPRS